jgi:hypothetical protein
MAKRIEVPTGWLVTIMGDEDGTLVAKNGKSGQEALMTNLQVPFPGPEVILSVLGNYKVGIKDANGKTHSYQGPKAACAEAWKLKMETLRGLLRPGRKYPVTEAKIREVASKMVSYEFRASVGAAAKMSGEQFDAQWAEALAAAEGDALKAMEIMKAHVTS